MRTTTKTNFVGFVGTVDGKPVWVLNEGKGNDTGKEIYKVKYGRIAGWSAEWAGRTVRPDITYTGKAVWVYKEKVRRGLKGLGTKS